LVDIHEEPIYLDILIPSTLPIHYEIPATTYKIYESPSRISLTEDPFQLAIPISHSAMPASTATRMPETGSKPDLNNNAVARAQLKKTYICLDAKNSQDLGTVYKVSKGGPA
jgi:hypothetical protein